MTLVANMDIFPNNAVDLLTSRFKLYDATWHVFSRPLRATDPDESIGVFATLWNPNDESFEMRGNAPGPSDPTLQRYMITVHAFVKDGDEVRGLARHNTFAKIIRTMLYRDEPLRVGLRALDVTHQNTRERLTKWSCRNQRYFNNEISNTWVYLSTLEIWIETEIT